MRKNLGPKAFLMPMPVLLVASYDEEGIPNAMNAAYGCLSDSDAITLYLHKGSKTVQNILETKAFTVNLADLAHLVEADYLGVVSGNDLADKLERTGLTVTKSDFVEAPILADLPLCLECEFLGYDPGDGCLAGKIINVSVASRYIDDEGAIDVESMGLLSYNPAQTCYNLLGQALAPAFANQQAFDPEAPAETVDEEDPVARKAYLAQDLDQRIKRIQEMGEIMAELSDRQAELNQALSHFEAFMGRANRFDAYYSSPAWMEDYEADSYQLLPDDLNLAVINEDIPYDVLGENYQLSQRLKALAIRLDLAQKGILSED